MKYRKTIKTPTLGVNAKSYLWGDELLEVARHCEKIAIEHDITVCMNVPFVDIYRVSQEAPHVFINAQGVDGIKPGGTMGGALPEALKAAGADGVIINHAARPMTLNDVVKSVERCKEVGLYTYVCADSVEEAVMMATLHPTGIICEQTRLIGTGIVADEDYLLSTTKAIRDIDPNIIISQGAGIKTGDDIVRNISLGSESGGGASGIFCSEDPIKTIDEFVQAILKARKEYGSRTIDGNELYG